MHHKNMKRTIRKELKKKYPNWKSLSKKEKKVIANKVLKEVTDNYDFSQQITAPVHELIGLEEQLENSKIMDLEAMARFIEDDKKSQLFSISKIKSHPAIIDEELKFIDQLLDDLIINKLLSYEGYSPAMREFMPSTFLRAELLKAIKFPETSYRKFCGDDKRYSGYKKNNSYTGMSQKENRAFLGLPLNRKMFLSHAQLSQFRSSLTFTQLVNLTVYILYHLQSHGYFSEDSIHCVDSTELAIDRQQLLAVLEIDGKNIRIYDDVDCDCGSRRKKRDKSTYVVGYRMHTLTAINAKTGHSYPLISVFAPANHHDSHFLMPLIRLGKAMGLDLRFITADEAYNDKDGRIYQETGVNLIKPPSKKTSIPKNVDSESMLVYCNDQCEIPMKYVGFEDMLHEFKCRSKFGECPYSGSCPRYREISLDSGYFQQIIYGSKEVLKALDIRKNGERPFNLLKKREGLEQVRVRSQHGVIVRGMISTMATLLLEMTGTRKKQGKKKKQIQFQLPEAA